MLRARTRQGSLATSVPQGEKLRLTEGAREAMCRCWASGPESLDVLELCLCAGQRAQRFADDLAQKLGCGFRTQVNNQLSALQRIFEFR